MCRFRNRILAIVISCIFLLCLGGSHSGEAFMPSPVLSASAANVTKQPTAAPVEVSSLSTTSKLEVYSSNSDEYDSFWKYVFPEAIPNSKINSEDDDFDNSDDFDGFYEEDEELDDVEELICSRTQDEYELYTSNSDFYISKSIIKRLNSIKKSYPKVSVAWGIFSLESDDYICTNNSETYFPSCCTVKAPFCLYCLKQVKRGKASLDDVLIYDIYRHHYYSKTASASKIYSLGRSKFTLKEVIYYCLYCSDNDAYMMLLDYFGTDGFNKEMARIGSTTSLDNGLLFGYANVKNRATEWKEIYSFLGNDSKCASFFKETLDSAKYGYIEDGIGIETAHKSGWSKSNGTANDCAIVYSENGDYLMIILTQNTASNNPQKALVSELAAVLNDLYDDYYENL